MHTISYLGVLRSSVHDPIMYEGFFKRNVNKSSSSGTQRVP